MFREQNCLLFYFFSKRLRGKFLKPYKIVGTQKNLKLKQNKVFKLVQFFIGLKGALRKIVIYYREIYFNITQLWAVSACFSKINALFFSLRRNVRTAKSLTAECPYGKVFSRWSILTA